MDAFLESYHVQRLHTHEHRQVLRRRRHRRRQDRHPPALGGRPRPNISPRSTITTGRRCAAVITFAYQLFPATIIIMSPDYVNVMVLMPQAAGRTLVEDFMLIPEAPTTRRGRAIIGRRAGDCSTRACSPREDFRAAALGQQGLEVGRARPADPGHARSRDHRIPPADRARARGLVLVVKAQPGRQFFDRLALETGVERVERGFQNPVGIGLGEAADREAARLHRAIAADEQ